MKNILICGPPGVGKTTLIKKILENIKLLSQALRDDELIIIDEIGKMEVFSEKFKEKVLDCLNSKKIVLATISIGGDKFISNIKRRDDIILFEITKENRNELIEIISSLIFNLKKKGFR